jgi:hypothetical protein
LNKLGVKAFSLVETLVAAAVIGVAAFAVIAVVRKGQEQMVVDKHRRTARAIVNTILEAPRFSPGNYLSILNTTTIPGSYIIDNKSNLQATSTFAITDNLYADAVSRIPYKKIWVKLQWTEPVGGAVDFVAMEKWVPNIPRPNIAPMATNVASPTPFNDCNIFALTANCPGGCQCLGWHGVVSSPEIYFANPWCAVDGIIGARINGDWADNNNANPIVIQWGAANPHRINKIVLYNRNNNAIAPGDCWATGARITLFRNGVAVGTITTNTGFANGTVVPIFLSPTNADEIRVWPLGGKSWPGMSEIEVYE